MSFFICVKCGGVRKYIKIITHHLLNTYFIGAKFAFIYEVFIRSGVSKHRS